MAKSIDKNNWNQATQLLVAKLAAFKDVSAGKTNLFPIDASAYLTDMIDDYTKVIAVEKPKPTNPQIMVEASWWGSRALSWLALFKLDKDERKIRWSMINYLHKATYDLRNIENNLISNNIKGDAEAIIAMADVLNNFLNTFIFKLELLKELENKRPQKESIQVPDQVITEPEAPSVNAEPSQFSKEYDLAKIEQIMTPIDAQVVAIRNSSKVEKVFRGRVTQGHDDLRRLISANNEGNYEEIKHRILALQGLISSVSGVAGKEVLDEREEYQKIAHNVVTRWLKRKWLALSPNNYEDAKVIIVDDILDLVKAFNVLMDVLGSTASTTDSIYDSTKYVVALLGSIAERMAMLGHSYRNTWRQLDRKERPQVLHKEIITLLGKFKILLENRVADKQEDDEE